MDTLWHDLRFALRNLLQRPVYTVAALLAIGLGVGANTAIFSVFDAVLLDPLPYHEADRLVRVWETQDARGIDRERPSPVTFHDFREQTQSFSGWTGWWYPDLNLTGGDSEPERIAAINVTDEFFDVLGVTPVRGRGFLDGEDVSGAPPIAVIGHGVWQRRFGGREDILDEEVLLDGRSYPIVGVAPPGFDFPDKTEIWLPLGWDPSQHNRAARFFGVVARLEDGVEMAAAQAEIDTMTLGFEREFPGTNEGWGAVLVPLADDIVGDLRPALWVLLGAVAFVLLIACANVANLLLAQALAREQEVAVRTALGAGRLRMLRQFLVESTCLGMLGGLLGLILASTGMWFLLRLAPDLPRLQGVGLDARVLIFTFAVALLASLIFGLAPAWQASRTDLTVALKDGGRGASGGRRSRRLRQLLVVGEMALAVILLSGAGLLIRSFMNLLEQHPGFSVERVVSFNLQLPRASYEDWTDVTAFYNNLLDHLQTRPGVTGAAVTGFMPLELGWRVDFDIVGFEAASDSDQPEAQYHPVSPGYFRLLGIPLLAGRNFDDRDTPDKPGVVILNQAAVDRYFEGQAPLGDTLGGQARQFGPLGRLLTETLEVEVVGVVGNARNVGLETETEPAMYFPQQQFAYRSMNVLVRAKGEPDALLNTLEAAVWDLDKALPVSSLQTLEQHVDAAMAERRFIMQLLTLFAALALILALIGTYGVMAYTAGQRQQEVGVRLALGAGRRDIVRLLVRQGLVLTICGLGAGLIAAWWLRGLLASLVFGVGAADAATLALVALAIAGVAWLACYLPARRASLIDPVEALRTD